MIGLWGMGAATVAASLGFRSMMATLASHGVLFRGANFINDPRHPGPAMMMRLANPEDSATSNAPCSQRRGLDRRPSGPEVPLLTGEIKFGFARWADRKGEGKVIASVLREANTASDACQSLIDLALAGGGSDNVTVVLARYRFPS